MWKRKKTKFYHDRSGKNLPELEIRQEVRVVSLGRDHAWKRGTCIEKLQTGHT